MSKTVFYKNFVSGASGKCTLEEWEKLKNSPNLKNKLVLVKIEDNPTIPAEAVVKELPKVKQQKQQDTENAPPVE